MESYRPAPPSTASTQQVRHEEVAQHLAASVPGFGNPAGLRFRGAVHATTAFTQRRPNSLEASAEGAAVGHVSAHNAGQAYATPAYAAPTGPAHGTMTAPVRPTCFVFGVSRSQFKVRGITARVCVCVCAVGFGNTCRRFVVAHKYPYGLQNSTGAQRSASVCARLSSSFHTE